MYTLSTDNSLDTGKTYTGRTLRDIWRKVAADLRVDGARTLWVAERWDRGQPSGREVSASLYEGEDYIRDARGRAVLL